ncbi:MAG: ATP-dependent DNA helicase RecG [Gammaproteobacteria bacterium]|nr:MAG: ATP-dependent DNA helicase RecG [Gammaproteobacteria bacterium]
MTDKAITLHSDVQALPGVGPAVAQKLGKRHIHQVADFLFLLPYKYQDRTRITAVNDLIYGEYAQVLVTVERARVQYGRQRSLVIDCYDDSGFLTVRLFHFSKAQMKLFHANKRLLVYGQVVQGLGQSSGRWAMMHPECSVLKTGEVVKLGDQLTPVYPNTLGIGSNKLRHWATVALSCLDKESLGDFPDSFLAKHHLSPLKQALRAIHQPRAGQKENDLLDPQSPHLRRVVLDELLAKQIGMLRKKAQTQQSDAFKLTLYSDKQGQLLAQLPFTLTAAQRRVVDEIFTDLAKPHPMHRLLQGDVGSGKTLVAFSAVLQAVANGLQSVIMTPTEILSEQHLAQAKKLLKPLGVGVAWLSGKITARQRRQLLGQIADGTAQVIIGTHALFQDDVVYQRLGLAVIDEQHRFGVHQRLLLKEKAQNTGKVPHILVMTATPIPRTLAMSFYADLDTSVIDELPPGRKPIETVLLSDGRRDELIERIKALVTTGQQVYWVCPLIEESEMLQAQAAEDVYQHLLKAMPELSITLLHGRQKTDEKSQIIADFQSNKVQLLVSTTVIEVGVDVPNATLMVIENAERFGLAQLHQLRGRVGRGSEKSYCVLLYQQPLSQTARQRLQVIRNSHDGFEIAKEDLKIRGAGEILGTKQTGEMTFRIVDLQRDVQMLSMAYKLAQQLMASKPQFADEIVARWVGENEHYLDV